GRGGAREPGQDRRRRGPAARLLDRRGRGRGDRVVRARGAARSDGILRAVSAAGRAVGETGSDSQSGDHSEEAGMADTIRKVSYYYTTAPDKPGEGARLLQALRNAGVNLLAFHAFPSARKSQADFVPAGAAAFEAAATAAKIKLSKPRTAFVVECDERVGALASVMRRLGGAEVDGAAGGGA